jgi:ABC-type branched-subunit amino acid transport system permease subunit
MFKTDILFNGYYGYLNTGDDAFVEVAAWGAAYIWKKSNVRFLIRENKAPNTITPIRGYL